MIDFSRKTILFGGSFDPIHNGHINMAKAAAKIIPDSQIILIPAFISPGKAASQASAELRMKWLRLVAHDYGFFVWDYELKQGGQSFTINTLVEAHRLGASQESLVLLVGADSYKNLHTWKQANELRNFCQILVAARPGHQIHLSHPKDQMVPLSEMDTSSTAIRGQIAQGNVPEHKLPPSVAADLKDLLLTTNPYGRN